jgi:hypothetical protein
LADVHCSRSWSAWLSPLDDKRFVSIIHNILERRHTCLLNGLLTSEPMTVPMGHSVTCRAQSRDIRTETLRLFRCISVSHFSFCIAHWYFCLISMAAVTLYCLSLVYRPRNSPATCQNPSQIKEIILFSVKLSYFCTQNLHKNAR